MPHLPAAGGHSLCKDDDDVDFYPFGKRSKIVRRFEPQDSPRPPAPPPASKARVQYDDEFWDRIHKQPSSYCKEDYTDASALMKSSFVVHRDSFMGLAGAGLERLPSPKELYGKRRRGAGRKVAPSDCRMVAVLRHIQDIKKLQGGIDLLKKDKWGGSSHLPPEESWPRGELERVQGRSGSTAPPRHHPAQREEEREGIPTADPFLPAFPVLPMQPFPLYPRDLPFYPSMQLDTNQQFPASQEEFCAAPGADPVSSYVMATADRQMAPEGFLTQPPHKEFWGFCFPSEE